MGRDEVCSQVRWWWSFLWAEAEAMCCLPINLEPKVLDKCPGLKGGSLCQGRRPAGSGPMTCS